LDQERRRRVLSDEDVAAISSAIANQLPVCSLGLTPDDATIIKSHLSAWKKASSIVGSVIITAIAIMLIGIFSKGFWMHLIEGVKK
jgi:hypothetical protein